MRGAWLPLYPVTSPPGCRIAGLWKRGLSQAARVTESDQPLPPLDGVPLAPRRARQCSDERLRLPRPGVLVGVAPRGGVALARPPGVLEPPFFSRREPYGELPREKLEWA